VQFLGIGEQAPFGEQFVILPRPGGGPIDFVELESQEVRPGILVALFRPDRFPLESEGGPPSVRRRHGSPIGSEAGVLIEEVQVNIWIQERLVFVLSVEINELST
jgi:hypothetical protein